MIDIDAELLDLDAGWREVLEAYRMVEVTESGAAVGASVPGDMSFEELEAESDVVEAASNEPLVELSLAELPEEDERDDWLPRIASLDGFDGERLSSLHGRLIAMGWLGFEVGDRMSGMRYRITRDGQRVLDGLVPIPTLKVVTESDVIQVDTGPGVDDREPVEVL
jgi:hypothetical protein